MFFDFGGSLIAGAVVHHEHFDCARMIRSSRPLAGSRRSPFLIEGSNQYADPVPKSPDQQRRKRAARKIDRPGYATTIKRRGDDHEGPKKFLGRVKDTETRAGPDDSACGSLASPTGGMTASRELPIKVLSGTIVSPRVSN